MRKAIYAMDRAGALALLERSRVFHLASTTAEGEPVFRTFHGVVVRGMLCFHAAPAGEKMETIGREAVAAAEEIIATIPSYFLDPERACPATTYYRSAQVHGPVELVEEPDFKAEVLAALMAKYQPEGGHVPIDARHPLYEKAIAGLLVAGIRLDHLDGKAKLGQNRKPAEIGVVLERLWQRGAPGDGHAIDRLREVRADLPCPAFLAAPEGVTLVCAPRSDDAARAADLLVDAYWNGGLDRDRIARAHLASSAWVAARDASGALVGSARAIADATKRAWIYDVIVAPSHRRRGLGDALMRLLLDHPAVRGTRDVLLGTRDMAAFYARLGFCPTSSLPPRSYVSTEMVLRRA